MQKWIISANGKMYNHAEAFAKFGYIDWTQKANYSIGDEVMSIVRNLIKK